MQIRTDLERCISAGQCVAAASTVFAQDPDSGLVVLLQENPPAELAPQVKNAARICPARVIVVEED